MRMRRQDDLNRAPRWALAAVLCSLLAACAQAQPSRLREYDTRYYELHTALPEEAVREATVRLNAMAELYHERCKGFSGVITRKLPFFLYDNEGDYRAAGGPVNTAGVFNGRKLMAWTPGEPDERFWVTVQHEGFHQFVDSVIGGEIPIWVNEGLAEYFGAAVFTGDGFQTGCIPGSYLGAIKQMLERKQTISIAAMMRMGHGAWNHSVTSGQGVGNYVQAWSMVHFLAHADPRYQKAFVGFINSVSKGTSWQLSWAQHFGANSERDFEERWRRYWDDMTMETSLRHYCEATVATATSFLARAVSQQQVFESWDAFAAAARSGQLKSHRDDWLPASLMQRSLKLTEKVGRWNIRKNSGRYEVVCELPDGVKLVGTFQLKNRRVKPGSVIVREAK